MAALGSLSIKSFTEQTPWFSELAPDERIKVLEEMELRVLPSGAYLTRPGDLPSHWYGVLEGLLKRAYVGIDGRSVMYGGLSPGSWFHEASLMRAQPMRHEVVALRPCRLLCMPKATFYRLRRTNLSFCNHVMDLMNDRLHLFMDHYAERRILSVDAQVASALASLFHPRLHPGASLKVQMSQEELANLSGFSRQRCNEALQRMKAAGLLRTGYGSFEVLDLPALRAFGEER